MFFDISKFPALSAFEARVEQIKGELLACMTEGNGRFSPYPGRGNYTKEWSLSGIWRRTDDGATQANREDFPLTVGYIESLPGATQAAFSRTSSGNHIKPHTDPDSNRLRLHLGITIPDSGKCGLKVDGKTIHLKPGKCLLFMDSMVHEAWNRSNADRIVLIVDLDIDGLLRSSGFSAPAGMSGKAFIRKFALRKTAWETMAGHMQNLVLLFYKTRYIVFGAPGRVKRFLLGTKNKPMYISDLVAAEMETALEKKRAASLSL